MIKQIVVRTFIPRRLLVAIGAALPLLISCRAHAQNPAAAATPAGAPGQAEAERVIVTGSNIPTAEEVTAAPVDTLNTQEINRTGSQEVLTVLQKRNPDFTGAGNLGITNANINSNASLGGAYIQIRGFPTLVLYEGRRIVDSAAIASGGFQFSDVELFPAALISRIEVLKDGASAIYGSEAVGGVVNIFTKDDYQGAEVGFRYGTALDEAVAERRGYAIAGVGNETTSITVGMQYYEIDPLFSRQRPYSAIVVPGSGNYAGHVLDDVSEYIIIGETPRAAVFPGPIIANSPFDVGVVPGSIHPTGSTADGTVNAFGQIPQFYQAQPNGAPALNLGTRPTSTLDTERTNVIATVDHQVFGKQLELFGNFLYYRADFQSFLNAQPLNNFSSDAAGNFLTIPAGRLGVPFGSPGYMPGVNNTIFNPLDVPIDNTDNLEVTQRYNQTNPRIFDVQNNLYRFLGGLRSQITPDWTAEAAAYYSKYDISYENENLVLLDQLNKMIAGTATDSNGRPIPPLDFFAVNPIGTSPGQVSASQFNTIFGTNIRESSSFQRVFDGKLTGFPFELPGGKVGLALGGEFRQEGFRFQDSPEIFVGSVPIAGIDVKRDIESAYGELSVPIVGSNMNVPGVYDLELTLAGRYDHYEGVKEDAKVPKIALRYQPIKDLTLRATYSNSFIAPNLFQLDGPAGVGFSGAISVNGGKNGQGQVEAPTNKALVPSTAESYSAGFVYSPSQVPGLTITVDYFRTLQQGIVGGRGAFLILTSVDSLGTASPFANLVALNNFPGLPGSVPITAPGQIRNNISRNTVFYIDQLQNLGASHDEGIDASAHYTMDLRTFGQFELGINAIVYTEYENKTTAQSNYFNILGTDGAEGVGAVPDYKLTALTEYRWQGFTASLIGNYIPKMYNAVAGSLELQNFRTFQKIEDYLEFDGRLQYTFVRNELPGAPAPEPKDTKSMRDGKNAAPAPVPGSTMGIFDRMLNGTTLAVGCNNLFDRTPPFVRTASSNTDLSVYDPYGRFLYFEISKKF